MREPMEDFTKLNDDTKEAWDLDFLIPYARAFNKGYIDFKDT